MSNNSLPLSEPPRRVLGEIIARYGTSVCDSPSQVEALLRDMCGEHRREINLLMSALKDKVAADIQSASVTPAELLIVRLSTRLRDNHSLTDEAALWAVESWALALGRISQSQLTSPVKSLVVSEDPIHASPPRSTPSWNTQLTDNRPTNNHSTNNHLTYNHSTNTPAAHHLSTTHSGPAPTSPSTLPPVNHVITSPTNTSGTIGPVPPEIQALGWSWPGFLWNWLWMCNHGIASAKPLVLIACFIPYVNFIPSIYLGIHGNTLAWQHRRFDSIDHFKAVQNAWGKTFLIIIGICMGIYVLGSLFSSR